MLEKKVEFTDRMIDCPNTNIIPITEKIKRFIGLIFLSIFVIAAVICLICDYFITGKLSWSLIVVLSLTATWFLLFSFFKTKINSVRNLLIVLSIIIIPYLAALSAILIQPSVFYLGSCISIVSIIGLWGIYGVFLKYWNRKLYATGISCLVTIPLSLAISNVVTYFNYGVKADLTYDTFRAIITLLLSIVCFGVDYFYNHRNKE